MIKEDLFKHMSELDDDLIAEAGEEGVEVKPIHIVEGKKRFNIKPAAITAACCVLLAGTVAAIGINYFRGGIDIQQPQSTNVTADKTEYVSTADYIAPEPSVYATSYPENAKYQYKGDYSEFKNFGNIVCLEFAEYYNTYRDLLNACDLAVVGEFIDDPWQDIDPDDHTELQPLNINSYNCFKIEKILDGERQTTKERGAEIIINQHYAVKGVSILSHSKLTPMLKGDRWVYFLMYNEKNGTYYPFNDYMGRFPDPGYCRVYDHDPDLRESANRFLPAMTNKYGLTEANDFNENIYRRLEEILCPSESRPFVQCVYDSENLEMYNETSFAMAEFGDDIEFILKNGTVYVNYLHAVDSDQNGAALIPGTEDLVLKKAYLADINGDGKREICYQVHENSGALGNYIFIFDFADQKLYAVAGRMGNSEYYLGDIDGELMAYNTKRTSDGSRGEVISHEKLSLDMTDCFLHIDFGGHSEYCLHDPSYCEKQEGECPYRNGEHHEETNAPEHHGHSEYCLQDADYCAQQGGKCPYRQEDYNGEVNPNTDGGHSEYCLHNAAYCEQQEGECPYRQGEHHGEENSAEHHGHSEYCLQDSDYCAQQDGDCPYRQGEHHEEANEHHGHSEYCLQDADYCAQQGGDCPYRQDNHHSGGHHGDSHH